VTAYIEVFAGSDMELAFVCTGKKSVSTESAEYFPNMEFVLEILSEYMRMSSKYMMTIDVNHITKMSFINI